MIITENSAEIYFKTKNFSETGPPVWGPVTLLLFSYLETKEMKKLLLFVANINKVEFLKNVKKKTKKKQSETGPEFLELSTFKKRIECEEN